MELFISDLDGTLLDGNAEVTDFTRDTINRLTERGMLFSVATARSLASAGKILSGLELKVPVILMNGVLIYDMQKKEYIKINGLKRELSELVIDLARKFMLQPFMYSVSDNQLSTRYERLTSPAMEHFYKERRDKYYKSFTQVSDFSQHLDNVIYFTFIAKKEKLAPLYEALKDNSELSITYYYDV
ncbi:HAD-IIB family hydrolase, partial [uncultured Ruminococcus sp.]|uniref:HAD-IIB family hydrolase n=1 Tax=uncultured Ruminococcus sp. TaxID=165186 RepID=UPI0025E9C003